MSERVSQILVVGRLVNGDMTSYDESKINDLLNSGWLVRHAVPAEKCVVLVLESRTALESPAELRRADAELGLADAELGLAAIERVVDAVSADEIIPEETLEALGNFRRCVAAALARSR